MDSAKGIRSIKVKIADWMMYRMVQYLVVCQSEIYKVQTKNHLLRRVANDIVYTNAYASTRIVNPAFSHTDYTG